MTSIRGGGRVTATTASTTLMLLAAELLPGTAMAQQTAPRIAASRSLMSADTCECKSLTASSCSNSC